MREILWRPSEARINASEMKSFMTQLEERFGLTFSGYRELHQWSIDNPELFWDELWFFFDIITSCHYDAVVDDLSKFPGAEWFPGAKLNYAENMLRDRRSDEIAIIFRGENHTRRTLTWRELRDAIERLATTMRGKGSRPGIPLPRICPICRRQSSRCWQHPRSEPSGVPAPRISGLPRRSTDLDKSSRRSFLPWTVTHTKVVLSM